VIIRQAGYDDRETSLCPFLIGIVCMLLLVPLLIVVSMQYPFLMLDE